MTWGAADGILVEIEAEFVCAAAGGRRVGRHRMTACADGARLMAPFRSVTRQRTSTERAWASRPSARASVVMAGARRGKSLGRELLRRDHFHVIGHARGRHAGGRRRWWGGRGWGRWRNRRRLPDCMAPMKTLPAWRIPGSSEASGMLRCSGAKRLRQLDGFVQ